MPDSNLNTSISAMRTAILNDLPTATVAELVDLSRAAKSLNLANDSTVETAINDRAVALVSGGATQAEIIKISQAVKSVLSPATFANNIANITTITSSLVPDTDVAYDLGTSSNRFNDIYLDGSTIDLGGQTIKSTATGIEVSEITIGSGTNKVKLSANSSGKLEQVGTNSGGVVQDTVTGSGPASTAVTNLSDLTAISSPATGQSVLVTSTNKLYIYNGTGWYLIAEVTNLSPTAITGLNATYDLATDGTSTTITLNSTDPEGATLTWSHAVTTGTLGSTATITNVNNVFTITPSTTEADAGSFSVTFSASDGSQAATSVSAFTLAFGDPWSSVSLNTSLNSGSQYDNGYGRSVDISGDKMVIGCHESGSSMGRVYISEWSGSAWGTPQQQLQSDWNDADTAEYFGVSVAIDGNYFIAGAIKDGNNTRGSTKGAAYVFYHNGSSWTQQAKLLMEEYNPNNITGLMAGGSVDISGDYVAVGTSNMWYDGKSLAGLVTIYKRSGTTWSFVQYIKHPVSANNTYFGCDVSLEGNRLVVGEYQRDGGQQGAVHIYELLSGSNTFTLQQTLLSPNVQGNGFFGSNVELSGDYLATTQALTQQVFVYKKTGATWALEATISDGNVSGALFGGNTYTNYVNKGIRLDGNVLVITARDSDSYQGKAIIYTRDGTTWTEEQTISGPNATGQFGWGVAKDGDHLAIAQPYGTGKGLYTYKPS